MEKLNKEATGRIEQYIGGLVLRCCHLEEIVRQLEIENQELRKSVKLNPDPGKQGQTING